MRGSPADMHEALAPTARNSFGAAYARAWWLVGLAVITVAVGFGAFALGQPRPFEARASLIVGQGGGGLRPDSANAVNTLSGTVRDLLRSDSVAEDVARAQRVPGGTDHVLDRLSASVSNESAIVVLNYRDDDEQVAVRVLEEVVTVFLRTVNQRLGLSDATPGASPNPDVLTVSLLDSPRSTGRASHELVRPAAAGAAVGLVLGLALAALLARSSAARGDAQPAVGGSGSGDRRRSGRSRGG